MRLPWPRLTNTPIKTHQLAALRSEGLPDEVGLLILHTEANILYWVSMKTFDELIINNPGLIVSYAYNRLDGLEVDFDEFVDSLPLEK